MFSKVIDIHTYGPMEFHPITNIVRKIVKENCSADGIIWLSVEGATPALLILQKGMEKAFIEYITKIIPFTTWRHGNAYAHLTSTLISTNLAIPIINSEPVLNYGEEIYLLETRPVYNHIRRILIELHCNNRSPPHPKERAFSCNMPSLI